MRHIIDVQEWDCSVVFTKCGHDPLSQEERSKRLWLKSGSAAHQALKEIVLDKQFLKSLEQVRQERICCTIVITLISVRVEGTLAQVSY